MARVKIKIRLRNNLPSEDFYGEIKEYIKKECGGHGIPNLSPEKPFKWKDYSIPFGGKLFTLSYRFRSKSMSREKSAEKICKYLEKFPYVIEAY